VISPSDTLKEVDEKAADYVAAGAKLVWIVNPRNRTITVHGEDRSALVLRESDALTGGDVVPGFECAVADVFA